MPCAVGHSAEKGMMEIYIPMQCPSLKEIDRQSCCENTTPLPTLPLFTSDIYDFYKILAAKTLTHALGFCFETCGCIWCQMPIWRPFVYHAKTPNINQVVFIEVVSHLPLCSSCCYESPLCCAKWSSTYFDVIDSLPS
jgi:hypothetical protein